MAAYRHEMFQRRLRRGRELLAKTWRAGGVLPWGAVGSAILFLALAATASGAPPGAPRRGARKETEKKIESKKQGHPALRGRNDPKVQLQLAAEHSSKGRCAQAVFHWYWYLRLKGKKRARPVRKAIRRCLAKLGYSRPKGRVKTKHKSRHKIVVNTAGQVTVGGGVFLTGSNDLQKKWAQRECLLKWGQNKIVCAQASKEPPLQRVYVSSFKIDRAEVTGARWVRCVKAGRCPKSQRAVRHPSLPLVGATWAEAQRFCAFAGGRLPTEQEWEKAARGNEQPVRIWPWGRVATRACAALVGARKKGKQAFRPGSFPCDLSPYGVVDMGGNVREWVSAKTKTRSGKRAKWALVKGGSVTTSLFSARVSHRKRMLRSTRAGDVGFRCARPLTSRGSIKQE